MGGELLLNAIEDIDKGLVDTFPQDDDKATPAPKLFTEDCKVDFQRSAQEVHNKIRGLSPFPTAWAKLDDMKFNLYRSQLGPQKKLAPGRLQMHQDNLLVGCNLGTVILDEVQLQGKQRMSGKDFMNGYNGRGMLH